MTRLLALTLVLAVAGCIKIPSCPTGDVVVKTLDPPYVACVKADEPLKEYQP